MLRKLLSIKPISIDAGVLLLRLFSVFLMVYGWDKFINFEEKSSYWPNPFHIGSVATLVLTIVAELVCPVFIILGFYTRIALVPAMINMIMAILIGHTGQPFMEREHAFSFLIPFVVIFLNGPGRYSMDAIIRK
ncbi:MAG: DoxX family protein [Cyclobacteriaceae bacterium]|nr:DoxX family protein [Cyclobacteriaceae bacterium]